VIVPSGAQFYTGAAFPAWRGSLFIGALREQRLVRLVIRDNRVVGEEHLLSDADSVSAMCRKARTARFTS
jgi:glucose/arabinose dehydrogenase